MTVRDVMTADVVSVGPNASLKEVAELLVDRGISGVPVVDEDQRVLGVLSESDIIVKEVTRTHAGDLLAQLAGREGVDERRRDATTAYEAMTEPPLTIEPHRPVGDAARVMLDAGVNRLPVVAGGRLEGIVTRADLVRAFVRPDRDIWEELRADVAARRLALSLDDLDIQVRGGEVTIRGAAASPEAIGLLESAARHVPGVVSVDCSRVTSSAWADGDES